MLEMKLSSVVLIAGTVIVGVIGFGSYHWHMANTVFADEPLGSEFFRTYDPGPLLSKYGTVRQRLSSIGGSEATQTRGITAIVALPASRVAGLSASLRDDIDNRLRAQFQHMGCSEESGEHSCGYENSTTWGYLILERIEAEKLPHSPDVAAWRVRMQLIERPHK